MSNLPFTALLLLSAVGLSWALIVGIRGWGNLGGKIIAIGAGVLLLVLIAFVSMVILIIESGRAGHPF